MRLIVEYLPNISKKAKDVIVNRCTASMWSDDSNQYNLEDLLDYINQEELDYEFEKEDMIELKRLKADEVHYIEF